MSYAPGPWVVDPSFPYDVQTARGEEICTVFDKGDLSKTHMVRGNIPWDEQTAEATARLIAAAPDLLAALEAIAANCGANSAIGRIARQAIAKASKP